MIRLVSATGSFARSMVPLKAMPVIPVSMMEGISSKVSARLMRITVLDHLILTDAGYYSFADEGEL